MGGDSVLINGRPLNGAIETAPDPGHTPPPLQVTSLGGKAIGVFDRVRLTGVLALDCGRGMGLLTFDRCQASNPSYNNQEIHPVYAIDLIVDAILAGKPDRRSPPYNFGMTYYLCSGRRHCVVVRHNAGPQQRLSAEVFQGVAANGNDRGVVAGRPARDRKQRGGADARHRSRDGCSLRPFRPHRSAAGGG